MPAEPDEEADYHWRIEQPTINPAIRRRGYVSFVPASHKTLSSVANSSSVKVEDLNQQGSSVRQMYLDIASGSRKENEVIDLTADSDDDAPKAVIPLPPSPPRDSLLCPACNVHVQTSSFTDHLRSIGHLYAANVTPVDLPPNYHLRPSNNIGARMLQHALGWEEGTALGRNATESARKTPLIPVQKEHERAGIGVEEKKKRRAEELEASGKVVKPVKEVEKKVQPRLARGKNQISKAHKMETEEWKATLAYMNRD